MFSYIKGKVIDILENQVIIEQGGLGFELFVSSVSCQSLNVGEDAKLLTYLQVREDGMTLFGFANSAEKALFLKLISVSGIGAKSAINILSTETIESLAFYIASSDVGALSKLKGIGKKTAERIIVELKDKVISKTEKPTLDKTPSLKIDDLSRDAVLGLMSLGFSKKEAEEGVEKAIENGAKGLDNTISMALKRMIK